MSDTLTDAEIVSGLRQGDVRAWEALCTQYRLRLWKYVARLVGRDENVVADIFQETILAVAKAGKTLTEGSPVWPWLAAIGHNQAALYWRKTSLARRACLNAPSPNHSSNPNPMDQLIKAETADLVRTLLSEMPAEAAAILMGKYLDGLSISQLVQLMGGTTESVRSRLARARREFRKRYEQAVGVSADKETQNAVSELLPRKGDLP